MANMTGELHWNDAEEVQPSEGTVVWVTTVGGFVYLAYRQGLVWASAGGLGTTVVHVTAWAHVPKPKAPLRQCLWIGDGYEED